MKKVKLKYAEIQNVINQFTEVSKLKYNSYAYATGYLESQLSHVVADMPANKQAEIISIFQRTISDLQKV
jgi:hypothetical protein